MTQSDSDAELGPAQTPSELDDYPFDLRGDLVLRRAVSPRHVAALNESLVPYESLAVGEWRGHVHRRKQHEIHQVYEIGEAFEALIDHSAYVHYLRRCIDADDGPFIDEAFVNLRGPGGATRMRCGGQPPETSAAAPEVPTAHARLGPDL